MDSKMKHYTFDDEEIEIINAALELGELSAQHNIIYRSQEINGTFKRQGYIVEQIEVRQKYQALLKTIKAFGEQLPPTGLEEHVHNIRENPEGGITKWT